MRAPYYSVLDSWRTARQLVLAGILCHLQQGDLSCYVAHKRVNIRSL